MTHLVRNHDIHRHRVARFSYPNRTQRSGTGDSSQILMANDLEAVPNEQKPKPIVDICKIHGIKYEMLAS